MSGETNQNDRFKSIDKHELEKARADDAEMVNCNRVDFDLLHPRYAMYLGDVAKLVQMWQRETFGEPATRSGCTARLEHLRREVVEATEASNHVDGYYGTQPDFGERDVASDRESLASELADIFILLQSAADEAGMDLATIVYRKLVVNRGRTWGSEDSDGCIEHVEGGES